VDRVGKRRSVLISCAFFAASFLVVIALSHALAPMMAGLFLVFLTFEFALVASLAVATEVTPDARATMSGFVVATHSFGRIATHSFRRIVASLIALPLFSAGQLSLVMLVASAFTALAVIMFWPVRIETATR
jgi:MFS family permease